MSCSVKGLFALLYCCLSSFVYLVMKGICSMLATGTLATV